MAPEGGEIDELLSSRINSGYPRDLLRRFAGNSAGGDRTATAAAEVGGGDMGEIELRLSLGGCYAVEPKEKRLVRASSMTLSMFPGERIDFPAVTTPLTRTCSLPTETEEERRKRKEMECLKRMEAKRKRSEKRAAAAASNNNRKEENLLDEDLVIKAANGVVVPAEVAKWAAGSGALGGPRPASQGSIGSQGSSASGVSDFESRPVQGVGVSGVGNCAEVRSPSPMPLAVDHTNHRAEVATPKQAVGKPANLSREGGEPAWKKSCTSGKLNGVKEMERNILEEMPCVSTKGDGPNGRRIEGFLYKYRKGEEVRIVCVCHGSFLTPTEFVKHAGGGDVAHPLRHIVVNPTPSAFL